MRRYELLDRVGIGGMAECFRARVIGDDDFLTGYPVVVKRILPHLAEDPEYLAMFGDEARIAAALDHPNVVHLLDLGRMDGQLFMALEYVDGADFGRLLYQARQRRTGLSVAAAFYVMREVLAGLHHAHTRAMDGRHLEIVHRDIAPANVLASKGGVVKLTDFGVAKAITRSGQTVAGVVKGNTRYMSPEQISGGPVDLRADLYACGLLFWTLLVGYNPFDADPLPKVLDRTLTGDIPPPTHLKPSLPGSVDSIISRALAYSPSDRYEDAEAFRHAVDEIARIEGIGPGKNDLATHVVKLLAGPQVGATSAREVSRRSIVARLGPLISGELAEVTVDDPSEATPINPDAPTREAKALVQVPEAVTREAKALAHESEAVTREAKALRQEPQAVTREAKALAHEPEATREAKAFTDAVEAVTREAVFVAGAPIPGDAHANATTVTRPQAYRPRTEARLTGHRDAVSAVAFLRDGNLISASFDRTIRVWDLQTGHESFSLTGHEAAITSLGLSGDLAVTGSRDKTVRVWDLSSREELMTLMGHTDWVFSVALSEDARWALSGGFDRNVRLWNLERERSARVLRGHTDSVSSVLFHPNGFHAITASYDRTIAIWDLERGQSMRVIGGPMESLRCGVIAPGGKRLLTAGADGVLRMWDIASGTEIAKMSGHLEPVVAIALSPDGRVAATGSYDGNVRLWAIDSPGDSHRIRAHADPVLSVAFSPDGRTLASSSIDRSIALWPLR